jgi:hypothetical protein
VSDGHGGSASTTFSLTVTNTNDAPVAAGTTANAAAAEGRPFQLQIPADAFSDPDGDALQYAATREDGSPLPAWLTFDATSRTFSGTPQATDAGTVRVGITASDASGATATNVFAIFVSPASTAGGEAAEEVVVHAAEPFTLPVPNALVIAVQAELDRLGLRQLIEAPSHRAIVTAPLKPAKILLTPGFGVLPFTLADVTIEAESDDGVRMADIDAEMLEEHPGTEDPAPREQSPDDGNNRSDASSHDDDQAHAIPPQAAASPAEAEAGVARPAASTPRTNAGAVRSFAAKMIGQLLTPAGILTSIASSPQPGACSAKRRKRARRARRSE